MAGYVNGKIEIWCGDYAPYNLNILWYKRIILSPGVFSYELLDYDNVSNTWSPIQVTAADSIRGILAGSNNVTIDNTDPNFPVISVDESIGEAPIDTFQYARQDGGWVKVLIPAGLTIGETYTTAYRGDRGKIAYNHSQTDHAPSNAEANVIIGLQKNGIDLIPDYNRKVNITVPTQPSDIGAEPVKGDDDNYITDNQLAKLDGIEAGAQVNDANTVIDPNYIHIDQESLGELIETTELKTVTDNTKVAVSDSEFLKYAKGLSIYTYIKSKLDLIYQPLKSVLELYVTQGEKDTWNGKQSAIGFTPENVANKQNSLTVDGTGVKFATVDAVNAGLNALKKVCSVQVLSGTTSWSIANGKAYIRIPSALNGMNLVMCGMSVVTKSTLGTPTVQLSRGRQATATSDFVFVSMLSTPLTIDANEYDSKDATAYVIDTTKDDVATGDVIRVDLTAIGTGTKGLNLTLTFSL